jgi:hypothetical protein
MSSHAMAVWKSRGVADASRDQDPIRNAGSPFLRLHLLNEGGQTRKKSITPRRESPAETEPEDVILAWTKISRDHEMMKI